MVTVAGSNGRRAPRPGECSVTAISVLMTARLRDRSSVSHTSAAFSAATSGASTFSRAACSSSVADLLQPDVRPPGGGEHLRPGDQAQRPVGGHLLQVAADRRRLLPQRHHIRAALGDGHQIGGIGAGQPLDHELLDELSTGSACRATCSPGQDRSRVGIEQR